MGTGLFFVGKSAIMVLISDKTQDKIQDKIKKFQKSIDKDCNTYYTVNHKRTIRIAIFPQKRGNI